MLTVAKMSLENQNNAEKVKVPVQMVQGKDDQIVNNEAARQFFEELATPDN